MRKLSSFLIAFAISLSLSAFSTNASAGCRWVSGYWSHGYYHQAHKVCWHRGGGSRCGWRHGHRVCW